MMQFDRRSRAHAEELREVANTLGLAYEEGKVQDTREFHPGAPLFERWVLCENRLTGTVDGARAAMFDLMTLEGTGEGERRRSWTVIAFAQSTLPFFVCVPRRWGTEAERANLTPINFDPRAESERARNAVADFEKLYVLGVSDTVAASAEDAIRRHFCAPRLEAMAQYPNWHVQSASGFLVCALSWTAPAADRPALWHEALELRQALLSPVTAGLNPIPAAPGMDVGRQRNRRGGRRAGLLVGAVLGFFGSAITFGMFIANPIGRPGGGFGPNHAMRFLMAFFIGIPSLLVIGGLLGSWLGGRIADLRYRPTPGGSPLPRVSKIWVVAGAFLGWTLGVTIGVGLASLWPQGMRSAWLGPILFFSPAILCLIMGGFIGLKFAQWRARARASSTTWR